MQSPTYTIDDIGLLIDVIKDDVTTVGNVTENIKTIRQIQEIVNSEQNLYNPFELLAINHLLFCAKNMIWVSVDELIDNMENKLPNGSK
jgi:hypothetical protein